MGDAICEHELCTTKSRIATTCNDRESYVEAGTRNHKNNNYDNDDTITGCEGMSWNTKDIIGIVACLVF